MCFSGALQVFFKKNSLLKYFFSMQNLLASLDWKMAFCRISSPPWHQLPFESLPLWVHQSIKEALNFKFGSLIENEKEWEQKTLQWNCERFYYEQWKHGVRVEDLLESVAKPRKNANWKNQNIEEKPLLNFLLHHTRPSVDLPQYWDVQANVRNKEKQCRAVVTR